MTATAGICIVGTGHAGSELAFSLRQQGWEGPITLIGEEPHLPYQRPPLSKNFLRGEVVPESLYLRPPASYEQANVELLLGQRVARIDRDRKVLVFVDGSERAYEQLALATGGRPRPLPQAPEAANLHYLRTLDDASAIRASFLAGKRLVIIGGGYVGLEVAASAIAQGLRVTVLESRERLLARVTSQEMSDFYAQVHRDAGVDVRTGVSVTGFTLENGRISAVECAGQPAVAADLVVVGIGLLPNVELAQAAGLQVDDGIVVDEGTRTSDPGIVALGDCASFPMEFTGARMRPESVPNALEQARCAAATLVGKQRAYQGAPWFWSDQYDLKLQMTGLSQGADQVVLRGSPEQRSFAAFYFKDGILVACDAVNRAQEFMLAKRMVAAAQAFDRVALADETVPLKTLAPPLTPPTR